VAGRIVAADELTSMVRSVEKEVGAPLSPDEAWWWCLTAVDALAGRLFPQGIKPSRTQDDMVIASDAAARPRLRHQDGWRRVRSWDELFDLLEAEEGVVAFVQERRPNDLGHAMAVVHTVGGLRTVDPRAATGRIEVRPAVRTEMRQPIDVRVLLVDKHAEVIPAEPAVPPAWDFLLDPSDSRIGSDHARAGRGRRVQGANPLAALRRENSDAFKIIDNNKNLSELVKSRPWLAEVLVTYPNILDKLNEESSRFIYRPVLLEPLRDPGNAKAIDEEETIRKTFFSSPQTLSHLGGRIDLFQKIFNNTLGFSLLPGTIRFSPEFGEALQTDPDASVLMESLAHHHSLLGEILLENYDSLLREILLDRRAYRRTVAEYREMLSDRNFLSKLQSHSNQVATLFAVPGLFKTVAAHQELLEELAGNSLLLDVLLDNPPVAAQIAADPEMVRRAVRNPAVAKRISHDFDAFSGLSSLMLSAALDLAKAPALPMVEQVIDDGSAHPSFVKAAQIKALRVVLMDENLARSLRNDPKLAQTLAENPELLSEPHEYRRLLKSKALRGKVSNTPRLLTPGLLSAVLRHPILAGRLEFDAKSDELATFALANPAYMEALKSNSAVAAIWNTYGAFFSPIRSSEYHRLIATDERPLILASRIHFPAQHVDNLLQDAYRSDAAILRIIAHDFPTAIAVFGPQAGSHAMADLASLDKLTSMIADSVDFKMSPQHWKLMFSRLNMLQQLNNMLPKSSLARALTQDSETFAEALARPALSAKLKDTAARENLENIASGLLKSKANGGAVHWTHLRAAIEETGDPMVTPSGAVLLPGRFKIVKYLLHGESRSDVMDFINRNVGKDDSVSAESIKNNLNEVRERPDFLEAARANLDLAVLMLFSSDFLAALKYRPALLEWLPKDPDIIARIYDVPGFADVLVRHNLLYRQLANPHSHFRIFIMSNDKIAPDLVREFVRNPDFIYYQAIVNSPLRGSAVDKLALKNGDVARAFGIELSDRELGERADVVSSNPGFIPALANLQEEKQFSLIRVAVRSIVSMRFFAGNTNTFTDIKNIAGLADALAARPDLAERFLDPVPKDANRSRKKRAELLSQLRAAPRQVPVVFGLESVFNLFVQVPSVALLMAKNERLVRLLDRDASARNLTTRWVLLKRVIPAEVWAALSSVIGLADFLEQDKNERLLQQFIEAPHLAKALQGNHALFADAKSDSLLWQALQRNPPLVDFLSYRRLRLRFADLPEIVKVLAEREINVNDTTPPRLYDALRHGTLLTFLRANPDFTARFLTSDVWQDQAARDPGLGDKLTVLQRADPAAFAQRTARTVTALTFPDRSVPPAASRATRVPADTPLAAVSTLASTAIPGAAGVSRPARPALAVGAGTGARDGAGDSLVVRLLNDASVAALAHDAGDRVLAMMPRNLDLLALLAVRPDLAADFKDDPNGEILSRYLFRSYLESGGAGANFEKDFAGFLDSIDVALTGEGYSLVKDAARDTFEKVAVERAAAIRERRDAFKADDPSTWEHSGRIHYGGDLDSLLISDRNKKVLGNLAKSHDQIREHRTRNLNINWAVHAHIDGGDNGVSVAYVLAADGKVDLLAYAFSQGRRDNNYRWPGGKEYTSGPLTIQAVWSHPALQDSRKNVQEVTSRTTVPPLSISRPRQSRTATELLEIAEALVRYQRAFDQTTEKQSKTRATGTGNKKSHRGNQTQNAPKPGITELAAAEKLLRDLGIELNDPSGRTR
jgi:hypothetical protein